MKPSVSAFVNVYANIIFLGLGIVLKNQLVSIIFLVGVIAWVIALHITIGKDSKF